MKKLPKYLVILLIFALWLAACGGGDTDVDEPVDEPVTSEETDTEVEEEAEEAPAEEMEEEEAMEEVEGSIWVLLPDSASSARWETDDRRFFEQAFDAAGVEYNIVNAEGDAATQQTQAEQAITAGADVLVIVNLDSGSAAAIIANARDAGVAVVDYDRLTVEGPGADVYVSFDNVEVGRTMGTVLEPMINAQEDTPQVVTLNGGPTDNNATLFREGYYSVAQPYFDSGEWELVDDQWVPGWDNQEALVIFEQILTAAGGDVTAVFAANDGLANAVISAFKNAGTSPAEAGIPISGQDATVGGIQNILAGDQAMTVYKPIKAEAEAAAEAAIMLLQGGDITELTGGATLNNGTNDIPFIALEPIGVTKENIMDTVIADGFRTLEEICVGDFEQYCADLESGAMAEDDEEMAEEATPEPEEEMAEGECAEDLTGEEIVLYQQAGREGPLAAILGDGFALATEDAVNYINENGGVCGATVSVTFGETNYDPELEVEVYEQFRAADPKPIILFTYGSGATIALKDRVVEDEIINFAAGLNAEAFYNPPNGYTIGCCPIYSDQFAGFITYLSENWDEVKPEGAGDEIVVGVIGWANSFGAGATTPEALEYAESIGVTVLPLEEQAIAPDADVTGQVQNLLLGGANVIYAQNLSFGATQVIGTIRALGVWDSVIVGGVNWTMNTDVLSFLGENAAIADGYYAMFPYLWWSDTDNETVQIATEIFDEQGYEESARTVTYLTTFASFLAVRDVLEATVNSVGYENLSGATVLDTMEEMGQISAGGVFTLDVADGNRAPGQSQLRQWQWNGESIEYVVIEDFFDLPDTRPSAEE